jgi:hypothetical protein
VQLLDCLHGFQQAWHFKKRIRLYLKHEYAFLKEGKEDSIFPELRVFWCLGDISKREFKETGLFGYLWV